ncbi:unnamed protein product [Sphenostylis stenocarpa]|uniref:poly(ADP-ribose) glycohydrolase n=1 Tax=Sphenostylis stenocarpa TaxID=92480 RepID=A0AA86RZQ2_9FABA|nr:unnamed protein product [Sphenostylis stenocarpa]
MRQNDLLITSWGISSIKLELGHTFPWFLSTLFKTVRHFPELDKISPNLNLRWFILRRIAADKFYWDIKDQRLTMPFLMDTTNLPYLPQGIRSLSPSWPSRVLKILTELGSGRVNSGHHLSLAIANLRDALNLSSKSVAPTAFDGYARFFDQVMSRDQSSKWFQEVLPALGNLLLRFPSLLETHFRNSDMDVHGDGTVVTTALRLLDSQQPGIVFLSQELIAALLGCSFFCLFPVSERRTTHLQKINFDRLFAKTRNGYTQEQDNKIWSILHYFQRICSDMPKGMVSFERKVLPFKNDSIHISYPDANFWSTSVTPLCNFEVHYSGGIEDQSSEAVEVDFADPYYGGLVLGMGCLQEEIRFLISPELIAGMLFLPAMADNEAIEIVGVERFSSYTGYSSSFQFSGDYVDERDVDTLGRRKTTIVAIDALERPGMSQYMADSILRHVIHAGILWKGNNIGVATGNWGCGVFGGDPEIKTIIQWLAASQARRPFLLYYTFGLGALKSLHEVVHRISTQTWTVGNLWKMLIKYSTMRSKGETNVGFFQWLQER